MRVCGHGIETDVWYEGRFLNVVQEVDTKFMCKSPRAHVEASRGPCSSLVTGSATSWVAERSGTSSRATSMAHAAR